MKKAEKQMMVAVAEDVLKLLPKLKVMAANGYLYPTDDAVYRYDGDGEKLQANIPKIAKYCEVCARGALFLAHIHLFDGEEYFPSGARAFYMSGKLFPQAHAMEVAFECPSGRLSKLKPARGSARLCKT